MREILFRGKQTDNGEWIEGAYSPFHLNFGEREEKPHIIIISDDEDIDGLWCEVIPEAVGQYTGLTDKNGKRIFEGDIVTGWFNHEKIVGYIFYGGNAQFFIQRDGIYGIGLDNSDCWLEVIGNILDNPELLGGENNGNN